eukprot:3548837-Amphidinium_carterae.1
MMFPGHNNMLSAMPSTLLSSHAVTTSCACHPHVVTTSLQLMGTCKSAHVGRHIWIFRQP